MCHPHNEANHQPVQETIARIVDLAREDRKFMGLPADSPQKLLQVGIRFWPALLRLAGNDIYREKGIRPAFEHGLVALDEIMNRLAVLSVTNTRPDDDLVEQAKIDIRRIRDGNNHDLMPGILDLALQSLADFARVAVSRGVKYEYSCHGRDVF